MTINVPSIYLVMAVPTYVQVAIVVCAAAVGVALGIALVVGIRSLVRRRRG